MGNKRKAAFFPFRRQDYGAIKYFNELQEEFTLERLISPNGFGYTGKDAAYCVNNAKLGIEVRADLGELSEWECLIVQDTQDGEINRLGVDYTVRAIDAGKEVVYLCENAENSSLLMESVDAKGRKHIQVLIKSEGDEYNTQDYLGIERINVPVILVGGLVEEPGIFEMIARLKNYMEKNGVSATVIDNHTIGTLFGFRTIKHILKNQKLTEAEKIENINKMIQQICKKEYPEVIIMEAPDALLSYSDLFPNGFGIWSYMLTQAVTPDFLICSIPYELGEKGFLDEVSTDFKNRFGCELSAAYISNIIVDSLSSINNRKLSFVCSAMKDVKMKVEKVKESIKFPVFYQSDTCFEDMCVALFGEKTENQPEIFLDEQKTFSEKELLLEIMLLLQRRFEISKDILAVEYLEKPLTGELFKFSFIDLTYLFFELEKRFDIRIPHSELEQYQFITINGILGILKKILLD